jgi:cytochrome c biogenesis protein CcdA
LAPCVGPTLGVASLLAAQRQNLVQASLVILTFGIATALPFLVIGALSCEVGLAGGQNPYCSPTWC